MQSELPHFVLVHGSWMGGWVWDRVAARLRQSGVGVTAPTLTGLGDRAHLGSAATGLHAHVADVLEALRLIDSRRIVVAGHSYGSMVAAAVADQSDKVERLITLDGFVPTDGKSVFELLPELEPMWAEMVSPEAPDFAQTPTGIFPELTPGPATDWFFQCLRPMPLATHRQKIALTGRYRRCQPHYAWFNRFPLLAPMLARARADGWEGSEIDAGHLGVVTHPDAVALALLRIAGIDP